MPEKKYARYVITEDIRPKQPPPPGFLKMLEDEQYLLTRSTIVFAPRGLVHGPISFRRIDSPILFFTTGNRTTYTRATGKED
jgi:hypothetical protein